MFHPLHSYMYDVPGYPDLSCSSNMHIRVVSARFGFSKSSFSETNHPCVFDFTGQYSEGQCSASRLSLIVWGGFLSAFKKHPFFLVLEHRLPRNVKKGTVPTYSGEKSCHVNEINFLSKNFNVEVQIAHQ